MTSGTRPTTVTPIERLAGLRGQLEDLRRAGTASNVTLKILTELTEIVTELTHERTRPRRT